MTVVMDRWMWMMKMKMRTSSHLAVKIQMMNKARTQMMREGSEIKDEGLGPEDGEVTMNLKRTIIACNLMSTAYSHSNISLLFVVKINYLFYVKLPTMPIPAQHNMPLFAEHGSICFQLSKACGDPQNICQ